MIGRKAHRLTIYSLPSSLLTEFTIFAISASNRGGQFLNEVFICLKKSFRSGYLKGWWIKKFFQELVFKAFENSKRSGFVDR